jgi:hypothetical protein
MAIQKKMNLKVSHPMIQISKRPPIDWLFYEMFRKTGLGVLAVFIFLTVVFQQFQQIFWGDFFSGMVIGTGLMWCTLHAWARVFFSAQERALGLQRMLWCAIIALPLGVIVTFGVVHYWPQTALGYGFGVCSPVFYAIGPIWRLRNHESHQEQIP